MSERYKSEQLLKVAELINYLNVAEINLLAELLLIKMDITGSEEQ